MSDAAIVCIVTGIVTILTLWLKLKYESKAVGDKIEDNTQVTRAGTKAAATAASAAVIAASETKVVVESIDKKLNGGIDSAIAAHRELSLDDLNARFNALTQYVHQRNHDILDAMNNQSLKLDVVLDHLRNVKATGTK